MPSLLENATVLAATEILPADWRDLSDALELCGGPKGLTSPNLQGSATREKRLLAWLQANISADRVRHWERTLATLARKRPDVAMIDVTAPAYPSALRKAYNRPPFLFLAGGSAKAFQQPMVAVVGSRTPSPEALEMARAVATEAAKVNVTVVSGLAAGIDTAAHCQALQSSALTVAVLGSAIDTDARFETDDLAKAILNEGLVVSPFRPGSPSTRSSYPLRNSIISGLSQVSVVLEASERSGTRAEIDHALSQDRPVRLWAPMASDRWARDLVHCQEGATFFEVPEEALAGVSA